MEKDIKHLYFEVLEHLSGCGIGIESNIKGLCSQYTTNELQGENIEDGLDGFSKMWAKITGVLGLLERLGYIKSSNQYGDLQALYNGDNFSVSITKPGFDYYSQHTLIQSNIALNNSTLRSNKIISDNSNTQSGIFKGQTVVLIFAGLFTFFNLVISCKTYLRDNRIESLTQELTLLKKDNQKLQHQLIQVQTHQKTK